MNRFLLACLAVLSMEGFKMKKWFLCCAVLAICALVAMTLGAAEISHTNLSTHHFDLPCEDCHTSDYQESAEGQLESTWKLKKDINKSCTTSKCHNFDPMLSHPVGIKPKGPVPDDMPLDTNSNITCLTCHKEAEPVDDDYSDIDSGNQYLLRRPAGEQLCSVCHINSNSMSNQHWLFSTRAHLQIADDKASTPDKLNIPLGRMDHESRTCLTCHDDITTSMPLGSANLGRNAIGTQPMTNHPIGMDYMSTARNKTNYNIYSSGKSNRIRFFNGRLGCGSCHSLYAKTEKYLIAKYKDSTLCRKCHNL